MRYLLLLVALLSTCCAAVPRYAARSSVSGLVRELSDETVALIIADTDDASVIIPFCSGVWVNDGTILTAAHCAAAIEGKPLRYIVEGEVTGQFLEPKTSHNASVRMLDETHDLALLDAPNAPPHRNADLSGRVPVPGDRLHCIGQDRSFYWTYIQGWMSRQWDTLKALPHEGEEGPWLQVTAPVSRGMSGSGVFDDTGKLVGILSFISEAPSVSFYIHLDTIRNFVRAKQTKRAG